MKRLGLLTLILLFVFSIGSHGATTPALKVGDYIQFGSYQSLPIKWQIINMDREGNPLLLSSEVIDYMAFDGAESGVYGGGMTERESYGSNDWTTSNLRSWLNSDEKNVTFIGKGPTVAAVADVQGFDSETKNYAYATKEGFLTGFNTVEKNMIKSTNLSSVKAYVEAGLSANHLQIFGFSSSNIREALLPYHSTLKSLSLDQIFLLSMDEMVQYVLNNNLEYLRSPSIDAQIGDYKKYASYWLRTADGKSGSQVSIMHTGGGVFKNQAAFSVTGVVPALYLKASSLSIDNGNGSYNAPYLFETTVGDSKKVNKATQTLLDEKIGTYKLLTNVEKSSPLILETITKELEYLLSESHKVIISENKSPMLSELITQNVIDGMMNSRAYTLEKLGENGIVLNRSMKINPSIQLMNASDIKITIDGKAISHLNDVSNIRVMNMDSTLGLGLQTKNIRAYGVKSGDMTVSLEKIENQYHLVLKDQSGLSIKSIANQIGIYMSPDAKITRIQYVNSSTIVPIMADDYGKWFNASGSYNFKGLALSKAYSDVELLTSGAKVALSELSDKGIIDGYSDGTFKPNNAITRGEFSKMLTYMFYSTKLPYVYKFEDVKATDWYMNSVLLLHQDNIIKGYTNGTFRGNQPISLQEIYVTLSRMLQSEKAYKVYTGFDVSSYNISKWAELDVTLMMREGVIYPELPKDLKRNAKRIEVVELLDLFSEIIY